MDSNGVKNNKYIDSSGNIKCEKTMMEKSGQVESETQGTSVDENSKDEDVNKCKSKNKTGDDSKNCDIKNSDPRRDLRLALQERRPSMYKVHKICCRGLKGLIPAELRVDVWQLLLGIDSKERFLLDDSIRDTMQDLDNQRVIRVDAERTRADMEEFRTPETQLLVSKLLTFYCKRKNIKYKQGLNELLAPFLLLRRNPMLPEGKIFSLFYAFIERFLPHIYVHDDFHALQCSFRLFRLLLQYHDPELCNRLDTHNLSPELYATPWFLTLFARNVPIEVLFRLWDTYLLEEDDKGAHLHFFVALALTLENRKGILDAHPSDLPIYLTSVLGPPGLTPSSPDNKEENEKVSTKKSECLLCSVDGIAEVIEKARVYLNDTPLAFCETISRAVLHLDIPSLDFLENLESRPCLFISARQVLNITVNHGETNFQIVDCRPQEKFEHKHLIGSVHLDPTLLEIPEQLEESLKVLNDRCNKRNKHCVFLGETPSEGDEDQDVHQDCTLFIFHAIQKQFKKVSYVRGGWDDIKRFSNERQVFESGPCKAPLLGNSAFANKSSSSTFEVFKDVLGAIKSSSPSLTQNTNVNDEAGDSSNWMHRIGKTLVGNVNNTETNNNKPPLEPRLSTSSFASNASSLSASSIGGMLFTKGGSSSAASPSSAIPTSGISPKEKNHHQESGSGSIMSRVVDKWKHFDFGTTNKQQKTMNDNQKMEWDNDEDEAMNDPDGMWINLSSWDTKDISIFDATKNDTLCILAISPGYVLCLHKHPERKNFARIDEKYLIADLVKITSKKSVKDLVVFHFKNRENKNQPITTALVLPDNSRKCIELVKGHYMRHYASIS